MSALSDADGSEYRTHETGRICRELTDSVLAIHERWAEIRLDGQLKWNPFLRCVCIRPLTLHG